MNHLIEATIQAIKQDIIDSEQRLLALIPKETHTPDEIELVLGQAAALRERIARLQAELKPYEAFYE